MACTTLKNYQMTIDTRPFTSVQEGKAEAIFPSSMDVFYNPVQEFNRDMSVAVLRLFASDYALIKANKASTGKRKITEEDFKLVEDNFEISSSKDNSQSGIRMLEALAASGLRSIRYAKEVEGIKEIIANDFSTSAVDCMIENLKHNSVEDIVKPSLNDANSLMIENRKTEDRFHAIDLDPYGSPHTFLDGAVQCVADGGLLLVTATDMAVLCGNSPETCYIKYGSLSVKTRPHHEMALRILLQSIEANANKYGRYIVPLLSLSVDFYVRVFIRIFTSQKNCKETFTKLAYVHCCNGCDTKTFQRLGKIVKNGNSIKYQLSSPNTGPVCTHCKHSIHTGGPIWAEPIHDVNFISRLKKSLVESDFNTYKRMYGILSLAEEELSDSPLYIVLDKIARVLKMNNFKMSKFASGLLNAGYKVSRTHACANALKTDAPPQVIWDLMRLKEKENPINKDLLPSSHPAIELLSQDIETEINFNKHPHAEFDSLKSVLKFQQNPDCDWGPKMRSKTSLLHGDLHEKRREKQGKRKASEKEKKQKKLALQEPLE